MTDNKIEEMNIEDRRKKILELITRDGSKQAENCQGKQDYSGC